ncbi:hypothetical protein A2392_03355 [Candidatus Kaiserbacteria bacterium RIFOXYB1_FULL_46_14]|uniref:Uncharacterized protein n=1 Tax=Candidatus Kaiserbacteria bacterium RIFOXYB1_FULL_46_14 TaxID=1798531 RepID=A0A1F6FI11_9BACT|nr:MAG: hypothetical protein A2392_03355 [Candidatus Kaiserbacteria bacterium RIFOXYB1_FULL_46_14]
MRYPLKNSFNKRDIVSLTCISIIGAIAIVTGSMFETIGSREIAEPIIIEASTIDGQTLNSAHVFFRLARAGTLGELTRTKTEDHRWHYENVFVENLFISASAEDLSNIKEIGISIGDKHLSFSGSDIMSGWTENDKSLVSHFLSANELETTRLLEAPAHVKRPTSHLPLPIFKRIINWGGDIEFFASPAKKSLIPTATFLIVLLTIAAIIKRDGTANFTPIEDIRGYLQMVYTVVSAIVMAIIGAILISLVHEPHTTALYQTINETFIKSAIGSFAPESLEQLLVVILIPLSAPIILLLYLFWRNTLQRLHPGALEWLYSATTTLVPAVLFALVYVGLALANFIYLSGNILNDSIGKYAFIIVLFPILFYLFYIRPEILKAWDYHIRFAGNTLLAIIFIVIFTTALQSIHAPIDAFHLNPILYPLSQLMAGKFLLVDVPSIYGLYPIFIVPIIKLFGFSLLTISAIFATLIGISYISLFLFMRRAIANTLLLYSGFLAVLLYSYFAITVHLGDFPYYQYWPIRLLFPALFLALIAKFLDDEKLSSYIALLATVSIGLLWNLDSGVIVLISLIAILTYHEFTKATSLGERARKIGTNILIIAGTTALSLVFFSIYTYIQSGVMPALSVLAQYQVMFASGYFMIPMPPPLHIWASIILVYIIGLTFSIRALVLKNVTYQDKLITAISILGLGLFTYYTGRSHDYSLFGPSFPALVLLAIFGDMLFSRIKKSSLPTLGDGLLFAFVFFIPIAALVSILLNVPMYAEEARSGASRMFSTVTTDHSQNVEFIRDNTTPGESVFILAQNADGLYYGESRVRAAIDLPSTTDLFLLSEVEVIVDFLRDNTIVPVFMSGSRSWLDNLDPRINSLIDNNYSAVTSSENGFTMFIPKDVANQ